jgi:hypothetical protein
MKSFIGISVLAVLFISICFIYHGQQRITLNGGKGWDGIYYYQVTEQIKAGADRITGELPFVRRLGTPFLVAEYSGMTGADILDSALAVNLIGAFIAVLLLFYWLKSFIAEYWICILLCFLFMVAWYLPVRYSYYVPLTSDAWGAVWFLAALLLLNLMRKSFMLKRTGAFAAYVLAFSFITGIAVLFRESNAILCVLPFFIFNPLCLPDSYSGSWTISQALAHLKRICKHYPLRQTVILFLPVLFVLGANLFVKKHIVISAQNNYSYFQNVLELIFTKSFPEYLLGILIAFGPLIILLPFFYGQYKSLLKERQELLILCASSLVFGYIGGTDTERILFMSGFPVIFLLLGNSIRSIYYSSQRWWLYVLFILQAISYRLFWSLPDCTVQSGHTPIPFFGLMSSKVKYLYLYSHFSSYILNFILLMEYFILFFATMYIIRNKVSLRKV